jgi:5-formyltetrahydrofolate cyclo-ligase
MTTVERAAPMVASPEEDPNVSIQCASPPCFMHELDPSYLGYLSWAETAALLEELLAAEWSGTLLESAWLHAMLRRRLGALGATHHSEAPAEPGRADPAPDHLASRIREALPRLYDDGLRDDLRQVLGMLERSTMRRHGASTGAAPAGQCWQDVRRWRKSERETLIARRLAVSREERQEWNTLITARLEPNLMAGAPGMIGFYWPFKGEYDPRPLMRSLHRQGIRLALPVVVERGRPLVFREWRPGIRLTPGIWNIPVPAEGEPVRPDALVVPAVGFDALGYRLGYGGGYYDRTLAAMSVRPLAFGVGFELARLDTIHPQPHDIPMSAIVTERRIVRIARSPSSPPPARNTQGEKSECQAASCRRRRSTGSPTHCWRRCPMP